MKVCESEYRQVGGTDDDEEIQDVDDLAQTEWVNTFFSAAPTQEVIGHSQLGGAPPATQDYTQGEQTPVPEQGHRSTRETIPPGCRATWQEERGQARTHLVYRL